MKKKQIKILSVNTNSTESGTVTLQVLNPIAKFELPRFKFMKKLPPLYFYTTKEIKDFIKKLPKDWQTQIALN